jgi:hypothetical protein
MLLRVRSEFRIVGCPLLGPQQEMGNKKSYIFINTKMPLESNCIWECSGAFKTHCSHSCLQLISIQLRTVA